jgi:hypothetical protein
MSRPVENGIGGDFEMYWPEGSWDNYYYLCVCPDCGAVGLKFPGRSSRIECGCPHTAGKNYTTAHPALLIRLIKKSIDWS